MTGFFLGVHGLGADGLTTPNLLEAQTDRALIACAGEVVVLADRSKWASSGNSRSAHSYAYATALYTSVSSNSRTRTLRRADCLGKPAHRRRSPWYLTRRPPRPRAGLGCGRGGAGR
ncbi:hypothetical protein [uncultured Cellulomonas sp.]|uniref:hypothetical protein n=1 Tax=uncultured Cellulomonas sp. TaxID=189682 RepID=UPI0026071AF6|nr:hypothetical protein [uncultured Cellulomonas sp.]